MIIALQIAAILGFKLSWPKTKLQNVGAGDPPSTILIDSVPVEGVEEFIYPIVNCNFVESDIH